MHPDLHITAGYPVLGTNTVYMHGYVCHFVTFGGPPVLLSVVNLRKEELEKETLRDTPGDLTLVKDCPETSRRKEAKTVLFSVPNKTPPFNSPGVGGGSQRCFKALSDLRGEENIRHFLHFSDIPGRGPRHS